MPRLIGGGDDGAAGSPMTVAQPDVCFMALSLCRLRHLDTSFSGQRRFSHHQALPGATAYHRGKETIVDAPAYALC